MFLNKSSRHISTLNWQSIKNKNATEVNGDDMKMSLNNFARKKYIFEFTAEGPNSGYLRIT